MNSAERTLYAELSASPAFTVTAGARLKELTRFGVGGEAALLVDVHTEAALPELLDRLRGIRHCVIGGGTNLVAADGGFDGVVVRYRAARIEAAGGILRVEAGAELQALVDCSIGHGLAGLHTMTRIPGWTGAAIYGNAGAYGHSIHEFVRKVRILAGSRSAGSQGDGSQIRTLTREECEFAYRESVFKRRKDWLILSADLELPPGDPSLLRAEADRIREIRDAKYPPTMKCAGSIFKNLLYSELGADIAARVPEGVVREGKVPSAWFLEQAGVKGMRRGDIQVAHYHANLVYNDGAGTAADLRWVIGEMKARVRSEFGLGLEEEVQFVGF